MLIRPKRKLTVTPTPDQQDRNRDKQRPGDSTTKPNMPKNHNAPDYTPRAQRNKRLPYAPGQRDSDWRKRNV